MPSNDVASDRIVVENAPGSDPEEQEAKAQHLYRVCFLVCLASLVLQIVSACLKDTDGGSASLLFGTKLVSEAQVAQAYSQWSVCQSIKGRLNSSKQSVCFEPKFPECAALQNRVHVVQASGVISIISTGMAGVLIIPGRATLKPCLNYTIIVLTFIAMSFTLILWSVVCNMYYKRDLCSGQNDIIDVPNNEIKFGAAFIVIVVAFCLLVIQLVLLCKIVYTTIPSKAAESGLPDRSTNGQSTEPIEPTRTYSFRSGQT